MGVSRQQQHRQGFGRSRNRHLLILAMLAVLGAGLAIPQGRVPGRAAAAADAELSSTQERRASTTRRRFASFESSLVRHTDGWEIRSPFAVRRTKGVGATHGSHATKLVTNGGSSGCSCPRMKFERGVFVGPGDKVRFSGSWRVANNSKLRWSRLMNLGYWNRRGDPARELYVFGLFSIKRGRLAVMTRYYDSDQGRVVHATLPLRQRRWFRVSIHARLSPVAGKARTRVYLNRKLVGTSRKPNMMSSRPLHFFNAGLSYFWPGNGRTTVWFDAPTVTQIRN